jgi:hypothetical protein
MESGQEPSQVRVVIQPLHGWGLVKEIVAGTGRAAGMTLLWVLEIVRDSYFRMLDRLKVRPRHKRASAFPPGRPRNRRPA